MGQQVWDMATDMYFLDAILAYLLRHRPPQLPVDHAELMIDIEQMPDAESRIELLDARDRLGVPQAAISWHIGESSRIAARAAALAVASELTRLRLGRCRLDSWIDNESEPLAGVLGPTFHFMGGTRMSLTPQLGVVDANCKVFGLDNLFVAGSSIFPSGGHINPTLTIVALAVRLADHVKVKAGRELGSRYRPRRG